MAKDFRKERSHRFQIRLHKTKSVILLLQVQPATVKSPLYTSRQISLLRNDINVNFFYLMMKVRI